MKFLALFKNKKFRLSLSIAIVVLVIPNFVFAYGILDFGVLILSLFARLTGWAGILLNLAIMELVFNMGTVLNSSIGLSVENAWSVIRDIMNLLFIFSLIYIGFQTILDFGNPRQLLPKLIIAALLINFSLFFTKFIVDVSNVAAVEIYTTVGFVPSSLIGAANPDPKAAEDALINIGVSGAYMQAMGLKDLISPQNNQTNNANLSYATKLEAACQDNDDASDCDVTILVYFLASIIFFLIAAYAFAIGAYMLLWRFIVLIILMIFSPFMFVGMIFPKAGKYQSRWWSTFLNAAFFAPAYMLMLYIGYAIASKVNVFTPGKGMFDAVAGSYAAVDLILNFMIVAGFLLMAVTVGKEMSSQGGKGVLSVMDNVRRRGQRVMDNGRRRGQRVMAAGALGGGAWALRNTAGRSAYQTANGMNERGEKWADQMNERGLRGWYARQRMAGAEKLSKSSFDPRQSMGKDAQKNLGTGAKGGFNAKMDARKKVEEARSKLVGGDSQVYTDYGAGEQYSVYKKIGDDANKLRKEIAASTNEQERKSKTALLIAKIGQQKTMEKGQLYDEFGQSFEQYNSKGGALTQSQFEVEKKKRLDAVKAFADAKKQEAGYGKRQYAENLKNRYTGNRVSKLFGWFYDDPLARKVAAKDITKKNASKSSGQKIEDIVKELQKEEGGGSTPPAPEGGAATT